MSINLKDERAWSFIETELTARLERARQELENAKTWEEVLHARGRISVLRDLLNLPQTLMSVAATRTKNNV